MKIIVLGSGSIIPTEDRFGSGVYAETSGVSFLIDPGPGVLEKLRRLGKKPQDLHAVFISHFHLDHVSDLFPLLMLWAYDVDGSPSPSPKPLQLIGPRGLARLIQNIAVDIDAFSYLSKTMGCLRYTSVKEMSDGDSWHLMQVKVSSAEVEHYDGVAYRFETTKGVIVYSGDTVPDERLVRLARGCDILIHECSFPHEKLLGKHTSEKQLASIVSKIMPRVLIVTHLYPAWRGEEDRIEKAMENLGLEKLIIAKDMAFIEI
ncbi:MAG: MBL fold metallo-hydrolase [Candidatus Caldarchaeum sp.]